MIRPFTIQQIIEATDIADDIKDYIQNLENQVDELQHSVNNAKLHGLVAYDEGLKKAAEIARVAIIDNIVMYPASREAIARAIEAEIND